MENEYRSWGRKLSSSGSDIVVKVFRTISLAVVHHLALLHRATNFACYHVAAGSIVHIIEKKRKEISPSCFRS